MNATDSLVHPKEQLYFVLALVVSLLLYLLLVISIVGVLYIVLGAFVGLVLHGVFIGHLRGNGIRVSPSQFPEVGRLAWQLSSQMQLSPTPDIYVIQSGGMLNAFATRFLGRNFVVIYSDVLELAYSQGEDALAFVVAHELAHVKRNHLALRWLLYPGMLMPFLGNAYSRACEFTCDQIAAWLCPGGAVPGLLVLAAGKGLYGRVNADEFERQATSEQSFWVWFAEILSTHPTLPHRVAGVRRLVEAGQSQMAAQPVPVVDGAVAQSL